MAKLKGRKGQESADKPSALSAAPTAEALAAVGASQLSKAAQQRRQEIDNNRAAYATANEPRASHATSGADPQAEAGPSAAGTWASASDTPVAETGVGGSDPAADNGVASISSLGGQTANRDQNGHAAAAPGDQASGEEVSSDSSSEGDEAQLGAAGGAEVTELLLVGYMSALKRCPGALMQTG